jgi:hypothetical protein
MDNYNYIKDFKQSMIWQKANLFEQEITIIIKRFPLIEKILKMRLLNLQGA